jgi:hypothetical protein
MPRTKKNESLQKQMCARLIELLDQHLKMSDSEVARALGYRSVSILWKVRRGLAFVDVERLVAFAKLRQGHVGPNIHWLISGEGRPMLNTRPDQAASSRLIASLSTLSPKQVSALKGIIRAFAQASVGRLRACRRG